MGGKHQMKYLFPIMVLLLLVSTSFVGVGNQVENKSFSLDSINDIRYYRNSDFNYDDNVNISIARQTEDVHFYGQSNESIYIVKVSNSNAIILDSLSFSDNVKTIGKQYTSGGYRIGCHVYDEDTGGGLEPLMFTFNYDFEFGVKLRYLHLEVGNLINYTYENRTVIELDNQTIHSGHLDYPWKPTIPPGTWYFVFSSVIYDLDQTDVSTDWTIWMNFTGNSSSLNISTGEGGKVHTLWYKEFDSNFVISKSNMLEMMIRGKADFHIENTFFYTYESFPIMRGFWIVKWITPEGIKRFHMLIIRGHLFYDEDEVEGCFWGMGNHGDYRLITSYIDYGRTILGGSIACYPIFVGLDVRLP